MAGGGAAGWQVLLTGLLCGRAAMAGPTKPNIVFLLTDDQDTLLGGTSTDPLPVNLPRLREKGVSITNWFVHTPVCCPSRAEMLTGRYFHNLARVPTDRWDTDGHGHPEQCMHINETNLSPGPTFAGHLGSNGYAVGFFGKYLNLSPHQAPTGSHTYFVNPGTAHITSGPSSRSALDPSGEYYPAFWLKINQTFNGTWNNTEMQYETALVGNSSTRWMRDVVAEDPNRPFFAYIAPHAPHGSAIPAPWYAGRFRGKAEFPITPSYNVSAKDHHWLVAQQPPVRPSEVALANLHYTDRWECLLSVDDLIGALMDTLDELKVAQNTYLFYTSDHGFHFHELRLGVGKWNMYDVDIRIHMVIAGPGIRANTTSALVANHVDLAPTWLGLAGIGDHPEMDGRSVVPQLIDASTAAASLPPSVRQHLAAEAEGAALGAGTAVAAGSVTRPKHGVYIEYHGLGPVGAPRRLMDSFNNTYRAIRIIDNTTFGNVMFAELGGDFLFETIVFRELYDLDKDPWQLHNIYNETAVEVRQQLAAIVRHMWQCQGAECG